MKALETVDHVDTQRFMGSWFVIAHIPPFLTRNAYNAVERYRLDDQGRVDVRFTFRKGGFDGDQKEFSPTGFPDHEDEEGVWGMRLVWPFKSDYRIVHLDDEYTETIIGRNKRDYVWIMARAPTIDDARYRALAGKITEMGYDPDELRRVPQQSLAERHPPADD